MNSSFVMAMHTTNFEKDLEEFDNTKIEELLKHFGEEALQKVSLGFFFNSKNPHLNSP